MEYILLLIIVILLFYKFCGCEGFMGNDEENNLFLAGGGVPEYNDLLYNQKIPNYIINA